MAMQEIPFSTIVFDVLEDDTEKLLTSARKLVEAEAAIVKAKAAIAKALEQRASFIAGVHSQLIK